MPDQTADGVAMAAQSAHQLPRSWTRYHPSPESLSLDRQRLRVAIILLAAYHHSYPFPQSS